jgi:Asp-tRNA(Asn)/Glu-tRNA(Gln) amidotransferase A subunit family amidase
MLPSRRIARAKPGTVNPTRCSHHKLTHIQTNCLTELLPGPCLARARELDAHLSAHGRPAGPLHGLPISVKEHIGMRGLRLHAGYVAWWDNAPPRDDALLLRILARAGAVFHARTTEPQGMMQLETDSNLYGTTVNPFNSELSAGGSSGGEGALVGVGGSCLGIGTDVGGSVGSRRSAIN